MASETTNTAWACPATHNGRACVAHRDGYHVAEVEHREVARWQTVEERRAFEAQQAAWPWWCHSGCEVRCLPCSDRHPTLLVFCMKNGPHTDEPHRGLLGEATPVTWS